MTATRDTPTPTPAGLTPEQAHAYHERAGIMEYDGHLPRQVAEAVALAGVRLGNPGLTAGAAGTCMGEPRCSPLRSFLDGIARVSGNVINAMPEEVKQLHEVADKCADEYEANAEAHGRAAARTVQPLVGLSDSEEGRE